MGSFLTEFVRLPFLGTRSIMWQPYRKPPSILSFGKIARVIIGNVTKFRKVAINKIGNLTRIYINTTSPVRLPKKQGVTGIWQCYEEKTTNNHAFSVTFPSRFQRDSSTTHDQQPTTHNHDIVLHFELKGKERRVIIPEEERTRCEVWSRVILLCS